jgi:hypothetical protein
LLAATPAQAPTASRPALQPATKILVSINRSFLENQTKPKYHTKPMSLAANSLLVRIIGHEEVSGDNDKKYMVYSIDVRTTKANWIVNKRFRDFHRFYNHLHEKDLLGCPPFPKRKVIRMVSSTPADISERQNGLSAFLEAISSRQDLSEHGQTELLKFLEAYNHEPGLLEGHTLWTISDQPTIKHRHSASSIPSQRDSSGDDITPTSSPREENSFADPAEHESMKRSPSKKFVRHSMQKSLREKPEIDQVGKFYFRFCWE